MSVVIRERVLQGIVSVFQWSVLSFKKCWFQIGYRYSESERVDISFVVICLTLCH
jgi:hypothetical protein